MARPPDLSPEEVKSIFRRKGFKTDDEIQAALDREAEESGSYEIQVDELREMGVKESDLMPSRGPQSEPKKKPTDEEIQAALDAESERDGSYEIQVDELREMGVPEDELMPEKSGRSPQSLSRGPASDEKPPDLTPDQVKGLFSGGSPPDLNPEEVKGLFSEQKPPDLTPDEVMALDLSGEKSKMLEGWVAPKKAVSGLDAAKTAAGGAYEFFGKEHGWLDNTFYALTLPEQVVARQAVNVIENMGLMSSDDARDLLVRDQLHGSDIVNFYWRDPKGALETAGRFVTGLAADILLDPLSYLGIGALTQAGKKALVAGQTINLSKMSRAERAYYQTLQKVETVIKADGIVREGVEDAAKIAADNEQLIARARDAALDANHAGRALDPQMGFKELQESLDLSPAARKSVMEKVKVGMTEKSWLKEWQEGSRGFTFGARVPFTQTGFEVELPAGFNKFVTLPTAAMDATFGFIRSGLRESGLGDPAYNLLSSVATRTGKIIFDIQQNARFGAKSKITEDMGRFTKQARAILGSKMKDLGETRFSQLLEDVVQEMEMGLRPLDEAMDLAKTFKKPVFAAGKNSTDEFSELVLSPDVKRLTSATKADTERMLRLQQHPSVMDLLDEMRTMRANSLEAYKKRGLPMDELNPFGEGWARGYMKHLISDEFIRKVTEVDEAASYVDEVNKMLGMADNSAKGRKFRLPIKDLNDASLAKHGVKAFVDDPIELMTRRMEEMQKIVSDHDLMESALPYAIKGEKPPGYVKFNIDHFRKLSLEQADQFEVKWDAFVPNSYKNADDLYLPEDVYNRMLFSINGHQIDSKPLKKVLAAGDFYTNVWRNNALFGAGYIGLNAFSNALTYLSLNDRGGVRALAKATSLLFPQTMVGKAVGKESKAKIKMLESFTTGAGDLIENWVEKSPQEILDLAIEHNLLNSSFSRTMNFGDFAEHVASNRQARQSLGQKVGTVADYAFLWRFSRGMAQFADEIPKLGVFISRLEEGFTPGAAAQFAEQYFYNFNNVSKTQDVVRRAIPFSSFPMKTAEMVADQLRTGKLAGLTIPGKVQAALDGAFVQDHETRQALDHMLPAYKNSMHPIHGWLMPGMREVYMDMPWSYATFQTIFSAEDSQHPLLTAFALAGAAKTKAEEILGVATEQDSEALAEAAQKNKIAFYNTLDLAIPPYMREALTMAEINGALDLGGFFRDRYAATIPTKSQIERAYGRKTVDQSTVMQKFQNAADFGAAMDKKYGENWLYNLVFNGKPESDDILDMQDQGARGEYIRRRFRQFTLGLGGITKLDANFFANRFAIERQITLKKKDLEKQVIQSGLLMDVGRITEDERLEKLSESMPLAKEVMALKYKADALHDYYDFFLGAEVEMPDIDLPSLIFGTKEYQFDYGDLPDSETYERLFKNKSIKNIPDEDAEEFMDNIEMKEMP